jgi:hypothetical protein
VEISLIGVVVCGGLLLVGYAMGAPLVGALFASLPFGSTAIVILPALGGSSPLVFVVFVLALLASIALKRGFLDDLAALLARSPAAQAACALAAYAIVSACLFPRLFAGATRAHIVVEGAVVEAPLGPVAGNITQTLYLTLGVFLFLGMCLLLQQKENWRAVERGFFAFAIVHAGFGLVDIAAKLAGAGDVLAPLRNASYGMLVEVMHGSFWRIVGTYPEASAFAGFTLPCLAFTFTFWRHTGSRPAFALAVVLQLLLVFSTSSTAYASLAVVLALLAMSAGWAALRGRLQVRDVLVFLLAWVGLAAALAAYLLDESLFEPFLALADDTLFNKGTTASGLERAYWNAAGVQGFLDTFGVGVGMGSSRASSWIVAVLSQLGVAGALLFVLLLCELVRGLGAGTAARAERDMVALAGSARAAAIAWLIPACITSGSADPGAAFFIGLAVVVACRQRLAVPARASPAHAGARRMSDFGGAAHTRPFDRPG